MIPPAIATHNRRVNRCRTIVSRCIRLAYDRQQAIEMGEFSEGERA